MSKHGENSIFLYPGSNDMVSKEYIDSVLESFGKGDIILLHSDLSVEEIINCMGYENKSFFRKIFKEKYGKNPLEFRKKGVE